MPGLLGKRHQVSILIGQRKCRGDGARLKHDSLRSEPARLLLRSIRRTYINLLLTTPLRHLGATAILNRQATRFDVCRDVGTHPLAAHAGFVTLAVANS